MAEITAPRFILSALKERNLSNTTGIKSIYNTLQSERKAKKGREFIGRGRRRGISTNDEFYEPRMRSCFESANTRRNSDPYIRAYWSHVSHTIDVLGDGNCGYRAIAAQIYNSEDNWHQVRVDLYYEVEQNKDFYNRVFRERGYAKNMLRALNFFESPAPQWSWMDIMWGIVIATRYNIVLHAFTARSNSCFTHLPFRSAPIPFHQRQHIAIALVNDNHFVQVFLKSDYPVPTILSSCWDNVTEDCRGWADPYGSRIQEWSDLVNN